MAIIHLPNSGFNKNFKWTDENIQTALHEMAHQKAKADQKWGYIFITQERIESLIDIVKVMILYREVHM